MAASGNFALWAWLAPAVSFLLLSLIVPLRRSGKPAAWLSIVISAGALSAAVSAWRSAVPDMARRILWEWIPVEDGVLTSVGVLADADSTLMLILVALVSFLVQLYSLGYLSDEPPASLGRYYAYQSLFAFSMMGLVLAPNFVQLFICWELVGLCSYLLIGYWYTRPEAARAAVKAFWVTKAGDVGFLIGIVMLWSRTGTFDFSELFEMAQGGSEALTGLGLVMFCIYLGAAGKSAQFPFHVWLPDAMEGPTPVSALIHAATMVTAGVYLLFRTAFLFEQAPEVLAAVGWIGAFTALLAATLACVQRDIKRVLAYSTVSQLGYMMAAIGAGFAGAGFLHLLTHGVFKALLFLAAGAVIHAVGTNDIFAMGGLARRMPQTFTVFLIGTLSLAGIPFFAGFFSKEEILGATWEGGLTVPFAMLVVAAFLTAFYMFRVVFIAFLGAPAGSAASAGHGSAHGSHAPGHAHDAPAIMTLALWVLALLALVIGVGFAFSHPEAEFAAPGWLTPLAVGVAVGGIALATVVYALGWISSEWLFRRFALVGEAAMERFWLDDLFALVYRSGILGVARIVGWVDRYIVDGVLNVLSAWTLTLGDRLRRIQSGQAQDYVYGIALGVLLLMVWMRWPR
ncbi:MAG TPA: NADH-quinone oxidoreductase subunit L [Verrucomicrobiae bacterium]|jgi:NADH-quinone oxidoreductase subunit L|nr:NADH-quinone oxidoreductase subunit L [Verrucomicrobiae bacterium]